MAGTFFDALIELMGGAPLRPQAPPNPMDEFGGGGGPGPWIPPTPGGPGGWTALLNLLGRGGRIPPDRVGRAMGWQGGEPTREVPPWYAQMGIGNYPSPLPFDDYGGNMPSIFNPMTGRPYD